MGILSDIAGWIASKDGRVHFVGTDKNEVLKASGAKQAAPLSKHSMQNIERNSQVIDRHGGDVVIIRKEK